MDPSLESWRRAWREGILPQLTPAMLDVLEDHLARDSPALLQGKTCEPLPHPLNGHLRPTGACPWGLLGWLGKELATVGEVEQFFAETCAACDKIMNEPGAVRYFLNWWDEGNRQRVRIALLGEVRYNKVEKFFAKSRKELPDG